jgi:aromatic ring-opening dioxygenase LigB subunit
MGLVFAAIAPHGGLAIREACAPDEVDLAVATRAGMAELGTLFAAARPQAVVVATPHNVHIAGALGVVIAGRMAGSLAGAPPSVALDVPGEVNLSWLLLETLLGCGLSAVGVSFGANDPASSVAPMDWGVLIPLWFMGGRDDPPVPLVVVTPARDLPASDHVKAGAVIAAVAAASGLRVAFIASADHGHAHDPAGPYGYHPNAKKYDNLICDLVSGDRLDRLSDIPLELVEEAKADSWWQLLMLHGATAAGWRGRLISYEAPTYFGMLTAAYTPIAPPPYGMLTAAYTSVAPPSDPGREAAGVDLPTSGEVSPGSASPRRRRTRRRTPAP